MENKMIVKGTGDSLFYIVDAITEKMLKVLKAGTETEAQTIAQGFDSAYVIQVQ